MLQAQQRMIAVASEPFSRRVHAALRRRAVLRRVDAAAKQPSHLNCEEPLRYAATRRVCYRGWRTARRFFARCGPPSAAA